MRIKKAKITICLPQNVKELIFKKYVGERDVSGFMRGLLQRRFFESKVIVCVECGSTQIEVENKQDHTRYRCKNCNNQIALWR